MRDPFLINNPGTRKVQHEMGLLYDSTINEHWTGDGKWPTSQDGGSRVWPYSMDFGIPQDCAATGPDGLCTPVRGARRAGRVGGCRSSGAERSRAAAPGERSASARLAPPACLPARSLPATLPLPAG